MTYKCVTRKESRGAELAWQRVVEELCVQRLRCPIDDLGPGLAAWAAGRDDPGHLYGHYGLGPVRSKILRAAGSTPEGASLPKRTVVLLQLAAICMILWRHPTPLPGLHTKSCYHHTKLLQALGSRKMKRLPCSEEFGISPDHEDVV